MTTRLRTLRGMSLIEMITAIAILTMGMSGFSMLFLNSWSSNKFVLEMGTASIIASRGVNNVVTEIRKVRQADNGDYPVESGDDFDLMVYLDIDNDGDTERVHYYLLNGSFYRGVSEPIAGLPITYPVGDDTTTLLASSIINTNANPVFSYYNEDYPADTVNNPIATPVDVSDVRMIRVHLMVNIDPLHAPDHINVESLAELRNINTY